MMKKIYLLLLLLLFSFVIVIQSSSSSLKNRNDRFQFRRRSHRFTPHRSLPSSNSITKLTASNGETGDSFGVSHGLAISNNRIVVGASFYNNRRGAAYLFGNSTDSVSGSLYSQLAFLTASDGENSDYFGSSVAIHGDIIVVGAGGDSNSTGAAYVFRIIDSNNNNNATISQVTKLTASNGIAGDWFGSSVYIHENTILVGAYFAVKNGSSYVGSAYLFRNPSNDPNTPEWTQLQQFQPNDLTANDWFGWTVAMDENIAVIGTNDLFDANAAYVFAPVNSDDFSSSWTQMAKLTGSTYSYFGNSVAVAGNWIIVGADGNNNEILTGAAFVFTKTSSSSSSTWTQMTQLLAVDGAAGDHFGISVSISKDETSIVVGAYGVDSNSGAAYLFQTTTNASTTTTVEWTPMGKFVAADRDTDDYLGMSLAIGNNIVVMGAPGDDSNTGSVYVVNTESGFSSSTATSTTAPTAKRTVVPTTEPTTLSPAPKPTNSPTDNERGGIIVSAIFIVGVVLIVFGILNYRIKVLRQRATVVADTPIVANVVLEPLVSQLGNDGTIQADAFLDPTSAVVASTPPASVIAEPSGEKLPRYKDQVRSVEPPGPQTPPASDIAEPSGEKLPRYKDQVKSAEPPGPSTNMQLSALEPERKHQRQDQKHHPHQHRLQQLHKGNEVKEEETEQSLEDLPLPVQQHQEQEQLHRDPPAASKVISCRPTKIK
jgi:hypothetical protein